MDTAAVSISAASAEDLEAINDVYNHYVATTAITFDVEPRSMAWRREWFATFGETGPHRLLVAREGSRVVGYASSTLFRPRAAYATSVETSAYLAPDRTGRGIGRALYRVLLVALELEDVHRALGGIALPNPASVALHERCGYRLVGTFTEQGRKFGRYWDVTWYERPVPLNAGSGSASRPSGTPSTP
ncbi:MAG: N-acetyltransferase family protein [Actinomycetota bacterium]